MTGQTRLTRLSRSVSGHRVLITGAGSGIGRATAHLFADEGALVAVTDVDGNRAAQVAAEISGAGGEARPWELDVADPKAVGRVVAEVTECFGGLDVLVNNAGIGFVEGAPKEDDAEYDKKMAEFTDKVLDVNLYGVQRVCELFLNINKYEGDHETLNDEDGVILRDFGRIVNITSASGDFFA